MSQIIPPPPYGEELDDVSWQQFFELVRKRLNNPAFSAQAVDPGTGGVPNGTWGIWKNTTSGVVKLWLNDSGTMKSVTLT